ncbi:MAG: hypothetical protein APR62_01315 [Smithella sp. SDB]|nr:MAG: hypothetical protein APR62_01315 [Smithella sp. SDB]
MAKYVATVLMELEDSFEGRRPDIDMIERYLNDHVHLGEIKEEIFRGKVVLNIVKREVSIVPFD